MTACRRQPSSGGGDCFGCGFAGGGRLWGPYRAGVKSPVTSPCAGRPRPSTGRWASSTGGRLIPGAGADFGGNGGLGLQRRVRLAAAGSFSDGPSGQVTGAEKGVGRAVTSRTGRLSVGVARMSPFVRINPARSKITSSR